MGLMVLLLGLSVGVFRNLTRVYDLPAAEAGIRTLLLKARTTAREDGYPTLVEFHAEAREARARILTWVASWHFEVDDVDLPGSGGAAFDVWGMKQTYGQVFRADPDEFPDEGRVGDGIRFRIGSYMDCGDQPSWNPVEGIILEAWIKSDDLAPLPSNGDVPTGEVDEFMVICKGRLMPDDPYDFSYYLLVTSDYAVEAGIRGPRDSNEDDGIYRVETYPGAFEPGRWTKVAMTYNGQKIEIRVNGVPHRAMAPLVGGETLSCPPRLERRLGSPLYVSHPDRSFMGIIDEVRIGAIHTPERATYALPGEVIFLLPGDPMGDKRTVRVHFDAEGRLDRFYHSGPVEIVLVDAKGFGPEDRIKREIAEAEAKKKGKKRRKLTPPEQRTLTVGEPAQIREDDKVVITVELSGDIK